jgi:hypothetical protein
MNRAGKETLASPAFAGDHHAHVGDRGNLLRECSHTFEVPVLSDDKANPFDCCRTAPGNQSFRDHRSRDSGQNRITRNGSFEDVRGACTETCDCNVGGAGIDDGDHTERAVNRPEPAHTVGNSARRLGRAHQHGIKRFFVYRCGAVSARIDHAYARASPLEIDTQQRRLEWRSTNDKHVRGPRTHHHARHLARQ